MDGIRIIQDHCALTNWTGQPLQMLFWNLYNAVATLTAHQDVARAKEKIWFVLTHVDVMKHCVKIKKCTQMTVILKMTKRGW